MRRLLCVGLVVCAAGCSRSFFHSLKTAKAPNVADGEAPQPPTALVATAGSRSVRLQWAASNGAQSFNLYWSTEQGATVASGAASITNVSQPFTHTDLDAGVTYYYFVTATNAAGESPPSEQVSATPTFPPPCGPKVHPVDLRVSYDATNATLTWQSDETDAEGFIVFRQRRGFEWGELRRVDKDVREFVDDSLAYDARYSYRVTAFSDACQTPPTNVVDLWTAPIAAPSLSAQPLGATSLRLSWTDNNINETGFRIERAPDASSAYTTIATVPPNHNSYDDAGLAVGTTYQYRLFVQSPAGESAAVGTDGSTTKRPELSWQDAPQFEAQCRLSVSGVAQLDPTLTDNDVQTASASATHALAVSATQDGFEATLNPSAFSAPETLATTWTVTDHNGATSTISRNLSLTVSAATRTRARRPTLADSYVVGTGTQSLAPACGGNCLGGAASIATSRTDKRSCYVTTAGEVRCFGYNLSNALGLNWALPTFVDPFFACETGGFGPDCAFAAPIGDAAHVKLSASGGCVLGTNGALRCFGMNAGTAGAIFAPYAVDVRTSVTDFHQKKFHGCAISGAARELRCWGSNVVGRIGDGTTNDAYAPVQVCRSGSSINGDCVPLTDVVAVATGILHTCAIVEEAATRHVYCWGLNASGELGSGATGGGNILNPQLVCETGTWISGGCAGTVLADTSLGLIAASDATTCVASTANNGGIWCWGEGAQGERGREPASDSPSPTRPCVGGTTIGCTGGTNLDDIVSLAAGAAHFCAVRDNAGVGEVYCWGRNTNSGALGTGDHGDRTTATRVCATGTANAAGTTCIGGSAFTGASSVFAGGTVDTPEDAATCVLAGTPAQLYCWGSNYNGKLGWGPAPSSAANPAVVTAFGDVTSVGLGHASSCVVDSAQQVRCVGDTGFLPVGSLSTVQHARHVCESGQGGLCAGGQRLASARQVTVGGNFGCALHDDQSVSCWGGVANGVLGDGSNNGEGTVGTDGSPPVKVCAVGDTPPCAGELHALSLASGQTHTCALLPDGRVACWGSNIQQQIGNPGAGSTQTTPMLVSCASLAACPQNGAGELDTVVQIAATNEGTCALVADGRIFCWGQLPGFGFSGVYVMCTSGTPGVLGCVGGEPLSDAVQVSAGGGTVCAVRSNGTARCLGANNAAQLGNGIAGGASNVMNGPVCEGSSGAGCAPLQNISALSVGGAHACALRTDGTLRCWGDNFENQVSMGSTPVVNPVGICEGGGTWNGTNCGPFPNVELDDVVAVSAGYQHTCAATADGSVWCWGSSTQGATGHFGNNPMRVAGDVGGSTPISDGAVRTCDVYEVAP